jgi:membrane-bound inhibitor of C-type lysozyme
MSPAAAATLLSFGDSAYAIEARYDCSGGIQLTAQFSPPGAAHGRVELTFATGEKIGLPQAMSADGGRYANGEIEFWIKGRNATLTRGGSTENCAAK